MSKLSNLKQEAFQAGKKRNWDEAVTLYERILELDKNNPTLINELGDLYLKAGDIQPAIKHFLNAAAKYRHTGLYNNSVAIYKKILRYDDSNLNAHWYLAETRASQGLLVEGELHGNKFLDSSESVSGDIKEIFIKRCVKLFELFPESPTIMDRLHQVFRMYDMGMEAARVKCLLACQAWDREEEDKARAVIEKLVGEVPEICNYAEFSKWRKRVDPDGVGTADAFSPDFNSINLDTSADADQEKSDEGPEQTEEIPAEELPWGQDAPASGAGDEPVVSDQEEQEPATDDPAEDDLAVDDDGCISIDLDDGASLSDLVKQAAQDVTDDDDAADEAVAEETSDQETPVAEVPEAAIPDDEAQEETTETSFAGVTDDPTTEDPDAASAPASAAPDAPAADQGDAEESAEESVDLLAEILASDEQDAGGHDSDQLATISQEIGAQLGGSDEAKDPGQLYEMGLVYLEMGLFDQACESFEMAASDAAYLVRAVEMWGIALMRANRPEEAVTILANAEGVPEIGSREHLGILYHLGMAHEQAGDVDQAVAFFQRIQDMDSSYHDVGKRLARLINA